MTKKYTTQLMLSLRNSFQIKWRRLKVKRWEKPFLTHTNQKKTEADILIWDKVDSRTELSTRAKETHRIMIKGSIHQEDTTALIVCITNNRASKYTKQSGWTGRGHVYSWKLRCPLSLLKTMRLHFVYQFGEALKC